MGPRMNAEGRSAPLGLGWRGRIRTSTSRFRVCGPTIRRRAIVRRNNEQAPWPTAIIPFAAYRCQTSGRGALARTRRTIAQMDPKYEPLQALITRAFSDRSLLVESTVRTAVNRAIAGLDSGELRVAEPDED